MRNLSLFCLCFVMSVLIISCDIQKTPPENAKIVSPQLPVEKLTIPFDIEGTAPQIMHVAYSQGGGLSAICGVPKGVAFSGDSVSIGGIALSLHVEGNGTLGSFFDPSFAHYLRYERDTLHVVTKLVAVGSDIADASWSAPKKFYKNTIIDIHTEGEIKTQNSNDLAGSSGAGRICKANTFVGRCD